MLSSSNLQGEKDYRNLFGANSEIKSLDLPSFKKFTKFIQSNPHLESRLIIPEWMGMRDSELENLKYIFIHSLIIEVIDRYIHENNCFDYHEDLADSIIIKRQNFFFWEKLPIDIVIPILFVGFPFESFTLSNGFEIRRLTEKEHLARYSVKAYNISVHELVLSSATHALVLKGWVVDNAPCIMNFNTLEDIRVYPTTLINNFFAAIRLVKDTNTGYAQVLSLSEHWANNYKANLPCINGTTTRSYHASLENFYWNIDPLPFVTDTEINDIYEIFNLLCNSEENSIHLSISRLNQCLMRDSEEDSMLDATIALEALLSDDSHQEMTYKLAMRVGALVTLDKNFKKSSQQAFNDIKNIYAYRSAIVHGSKKLDKKRIIKLDDNKETTTHSLAVNYLRFVLRVLLKNPKYRNPKIIDSELLLRVVSEG